MMGLVLATAGCGGQAGSAVEKPPQHDTHQHDAEKMDAPAPAVQKDNLQILVNGKVLDAPQEVRQGRTYVPADPLAKALGLTVGFNPKKPDHGATLERKGKYVHLHTDTADVHMDGQMVTLDAPAVYVHPETHGPMVDVEFVANAYGAAVERRPAEGSGQETLVIDLAP